MPFHSDPWACLICGHTFFPGGSNARYCSARCKQAAKRAKMLAAIQPKLDRDPTVAPERLTRTLGGTLLPAIPTPGRPELDRDANVARDAFMRARQKLVWDKEAIRLFGTVDRGTPGEEEERR